MVRVLIHIHVTHYLRVILISTANVHVMPNTHCLYSGLNVCLIVTLILCIFIVEHDMMTSYTHGFRCSHAENMSLSEEKDAVLDEMKFYKVNYTIMVYIGCIYSEFSTKYGYSTLCVFPPTFVKLLWSAIIMLNISRKMEETRLWRRRHQTSVGICCLWSRCLRRLDCTSSPGLVTICKGHTRHQ